MFEGCGNANHPDLIVIQCRHVSNYHRIPHICANILPIKNKLFQSIFKLR
jgi:hypothetical protein